MNQAATLFTSRLALRPLSPDDAHKLHDMYKNRAAMTYWHSPPHRTVDETREAISSMLTENARWWSVRERDKDDPIGVVGFLGNQGVPGMGYILHPDYWGRGYMTEAARSALEYGFNVLELNRVELWIQEGNTASERLAKRLGFRCLGRFRQKYAHQSNSHEKWVYGLHVDEWLQGHGHALPENISTSPSPKSPIVYGLQPILAVSDVKKTAYDYRNRMGFHVEWLYGDPPTHGCVAYGQWTVEGARIQLTQGTVDPSATAALSLYLFVDDQIDRLYETCQANGVTIVSHLQSHPWGMREFKVIDLNGYALRFGTPM